MAINRFTKYTAPQFIQAYDPYPMQQMMALAQHQQKRFDAIDTAIGKAYADAVIKPGLSTESRQMAAKINKERKQQLDDLTNSFYENRDVRGAVRKLSEISSNWQNDARATFVNEDHELMKGILSQTGQEGYGDYLMHKSYNPETGEHTLGITEDQILAGRAPTAADYGLMSNPGSTAAFKSYIDPVKERILNNLSRDAQGNIITQEGKILDAQRFLEKSGADIDKLSSDGWNIDQMSDADPETQKFIKWRQTEFARKGKVYTINDFREDFLTEAEKYTYNTDKASIKGAPGGSKSRKDAINSSNSAMFINSSTSNVNNIELSKELAEGGIETFAKNLGFEDVDTMYAAVVNPGNETAKAEQMKDIEKRVRDEYASMPVEYELTTDANGKTVKTPVKSSADIEDEIQDRIKTLSKGLDKAYQIKVQAYNQLSSADKNKLQINDDGTFELTPEAQKKLDDRQRAVDKAKDFMSALGYMTPDTAGKYWDELSDEAKEFAKEGIKEWDDNPQGNMRFIDDPSIWIPWAGKKLKALGKEYSGELLSVGAKAISDAAYSFTDNPLIKLDQGADKITKELYGSKTYYNNTIHLVNKDMIGITTQVNPLHQLFSGIAKTNFGVGGKISVNGKEISDEDLKVLDTEKETIDFKGGEFNPEFIEFDMVGKGRFKVYATGHINKTTDDDKEHTTEKPYQVDITQEFMAKMGQNEQSQLLYQDAILDSAYELVPNGQDKVSVYLSADSQEEAKEFFGGEDGAMISKRIGQDGLPVYSMSGKVAIFDENDKLQIVDADTYTVNGESPFVGMNQQQMLAMSRDIAMALPYLNNEVSGASMTPAEEAAMKDAGLDESEVDSFEVGAFGLDTRTNGSALKQVDIGFASNTQAVENPVDQMSPKDQTNYASYLFVNGGDGWNQWDVTKKDATGKFENKTFNTAINVLKGLGKNPTPGNVAQALESNKKQLGIDRVDPIMIQNILAEFSPRALVRKSDNNYSASDIANNNAMAESLVAIATVVAQSGMNNSAVVVNKK
jgi:hypothetical protein